jgi:macrolide transport system ATP-binding/permease protein
MKRLRAWLLRLSGILSNPKREREFAAEIEAHLQLHIDDNLRAGMNPEQARRNALLKLGGVESTKQAYRDGSTIPVVENLLQDLRFALRQLNKNLGFTCTAVFILALGICASVAIFAFVDAALIKPLPYRNSKQLVAVFESVPMFPHSNLSYPDYLDWKRLNTVFRSLEAYQHTGFILSTPSGAQPSRGARVSDGFFRALGVTPVLGRDFHAGEDLLSAPRTVLLSYAAWQKRYGGKPDVLGKTVTLNGAANEIIGVLPPEFHFAPAEPAEFWTTIHASGECDLRRTCHGLFGVARLKEGVSIQTALLNVKAVAKQLERQYPGDNRDQGAALAPLAEIIVGDIRPILLVLLGGSGLLLLIAGVNVASLLLVRSESRKREIAVRGALGASSARLMSQFVTEGLVLVALGSLIGVIAAYWVMHLLTTLLSEDALARMPYLLALGLNARVLAFAGIIALLAVVVFSLTPALHLGARLAMRQGLNEGSRGSAGNTWRRLGSKLVVIELATAVVLLAGAGLLGKSLYLLLHVNIGLQPEHLASLLVVAPQASYEKSEQQIALARQVLDRIGSLPGVKSASISSEIPVIGWGNTTWFRVLGRQWHGEHNEAPERDITPGHFATIGAKLLRGRFFTEAEDESKPRVVIVNQAMAKQYFPGEDPIGKYISGLSDPPKPTQIVGIVEDIKEGQLDSANKPALYFPFYQNAGSDFILFVRASKAEQSLFPEINAALRQINPGIVTPIESSMSDWINNSQSAYLHRSSAWLVGGFAALALLLSVVGLYGVVAYSVSQRTREIGVRMALGAQTSSVYQLVLKEAGRLTAVGIVIGLACSIASATLMRGLLFGVRTWDIPTLAAVAALLGIAALLASYLPARRAASVNPVEALRSE